MMAEQKTFEMLFSLNAAMNGNFGTVFGKAQAEFLKYEAKIKQVNQALKDVGGYEKQKIAVEDTAKKLDNLRAQQEKVVQQIELKKSIQTDDLKEMAKINAEVAKLEERYIGYQRKIDGASRTMEQQSTRLEVTGTRLRENGVEVDRLAESESRLKARLDELTDAQRRVMDKAQGMGEAFSAAFGRVNEAMERAGIAAGMKKIQDALMDCVGGSGDFEQAIADVAAISNASDTEVARLTAEAKRLGATTAFTAQQSAIAMNYMAMAGWSAEEMVAGLPGVLDLAVVSGEDLASVSDIVTDALTAFGLKASDSTHFADVLAKTASSANTNVAMMGETFKYAAPLAGALGYSVEDVATMIGLMANAGIKGSMSGTALRNMFSKLTDGATVSGAAFGEVTIATQNVDGTMRSLADVIEDLRGRFSQMTDAEKIMNAESLVGERAMSGFVALMNASSGDFDKLKASISSCTGAASQMAAVKLDTMHGQLTLMQSAWEGLKITIGDQLRPGLTGLYKTLADILSAVNDFAKRNPGLVKGLVTFAGTFVTLGTAIAGAAAAFKVLSAAAALFHTTAGPLMLALTGISAAVALVTSLFGDENEELEQMLENTRAIQTALDETSETFNQSTSGITVAANMTGTYIDRLEELERTGRKNNEAGSEYQTTLAMIVSTMPELEQYISSTTDEFGRSVYTLNATTDALRVNSEAWRRNAMAQAMQENMAGVYDALAKARIEQATLAYNQSEAEKKLAAEMERQKQVQAELSEIQLKAGMAARQQGTTMNDIIEKNPALALQYKNLNDANRELYETISGLEKEISDAGEALGEVDKTVADAELRARAAESAMEEYGLTTQQAMGDTGLSAAAARESLSGIVERARDLAAAYNETYEAALQSFSGQFGLFDTAQADAGATVAAAQAALESQLAYWQGYSDNIEVLRNKSAEDLGVTQQEYDAAMAYIHSGDEKAAGLAQSMADEIRNGNEDAVTELIKTIARVGEKQKGLADQTADWITGFTKEMNRLPEAFQETIASMELSEEARLSAKATIDAFVQEAESEGTLEAVRAAYSRLGQAAAGSLSSGVDPVIVQAVAARQKSAIALTGAAAGGTENAAPGAWLVGENGPEIVLLHGGESVIDAQETERTLNRQRESGTVISAVGAPSGMQDVSVNVNINMQSGGNDAAGQLSEAAEDIGERVRLVVEQVLEDIAEDRRRMSY